MAIVNMNAALEGVVQQYICQVWGKTTVCTDIFQGEHNRDEWIKNDTATPDI